MKIRKVFTLLSSLVILVSMMGVAPVVANATAAPFVTIGPKAVRTQASASNPTDSPLYTCQVGMDDGVVCYDPFQIRHAYNVDTLLNEGYTGAGRTIVIVDAFQSPTLPSDLDSFDTDYGLPARSTFFTQIAPDGLTPFDSSNDDMVGWSAEISLDVEWAHAIAPGAHIVLDLAKSDADADILSATQYAVNHNLGDVISQSFGENESCVDPSILSAEHQMFEKATLKHVTIFASSGDDGAGQPTCDGSSLVQAASSPASDPLVTAVGGTELHAADYCLSELGCDPTSNPAAGTYESEVAWNEPDFGATGGGFSVLYDEPFYQIGSVLHKGKQRGVPDVAYNAAVLHGVLAYWGGDVYLFGGTSAGSPQWAAITAIADQRAGQRLGFINAALYLYTLLPPTYASLFHDVTSGNNAEPPVSGFDAGPRWDATTGLGSPNAAHLVSFLARFAPNYAFQEVNGPNAINHGGHWFGFVRSH